MSKHLDIALEQGTDAAADFWFDSINNVTKSGGGLPQVRALVDEAKKASRNPVTKRLNRNKLRAFYCNYYAKYLGDTPAVIEPSVEEAVIEEIVTTPSATPTLEEQIASLQASLNAIKDEASVVEDSVVEDPTVEEQAIEDAEFEDAFEDDDDEPEVVEDSTDECPPFKGGDENADASSGQLYTLNTLGLLTPHFTKGEAHRAIWEARNN